RCYCAAGYYYIGDRNRLSIVRRTVARGASDNALSTSELARPTSRNSRTRGDIGLYENAKNQSTGFVTNGRSYSSDVGDAGTQSSLSVARNSISSRRYRTAVEPARRQSRGER